MTLCSIASTSSTNKLRQHQLFATVSSGADAIVVRTCIVYAVSVGVYSHEITTSQQSVAVLAQYTAISLAASVYD
jgi:hypothetical protein